MSYKKNIITLIMGNTFAQAIPLIASPILTRIYTPEDFGVFGVYIALMAILSSFINGQYHIAIVLPVSNEKAIHLATLSILITLSLSLFSFISIYIFYDQIISLFKDKNIGSIIYFIPISILVMGLFNILNYLLTRSKSYKIISKSEVLKSFTNSTIQIIFGLLKKDLLFLVIGNIIGFLTSIIFLFINLKSKIIKIKPKTLIVVMKKYIDFPKINTVNNLLYNLSQYLIHLFITIIYEIKYAGYYTLIQRVMLIPTVTLGRAFSQTFFREIRDSRKKNNGKEKLKETLKMILPLSSVIFLFLFFFIQDLFLLVFGEKWTEAGNIAQLLIPLFFTQFIRSSLNTITMVYEKQKEQMLLNFIMLAIILIIFILSDYYKFEFYTMILSYSITMSIINILIIIYYTTLVKDKI